MAVLSSLTAGYGELLSQGPVGKQKGHHEISNCESGCANMLPALFLQTVNL